MRKLINRMKRIFINVFDRNILIVNNAIIPSIEAVNKLKYFVESDEMVLLNWIIPGPFDDIITAKLKRLLPEVLKAMQIVQKCTSEHDRDAIVQCAIMELKKLDHTNRSNFYLGFAAQLSKAMSDDKLTFDEAIGLVWYVYNSSMKKQRA